jgi:proteasome lid subunit RPN8/RPN11
MVTLAQSQVQKLLNHAREVNPYECCGLIGGTEDGHSRSIYRLRNVATDPLNSYEAAPEELFTAQRKMRERGEQLLGIYHSHPRSADPAPSDTDVRLAYYPSAAYFIIGLAGPQPVIRAFRISEREQRWEPVEYAVTDE